MIQDDLYEETAIRDYVNKLKCIFEEMHVMGETDTANRNAIRQIGQQIYDSGIVRGMKKTAEKFAKEMPQHARRLDMLWDGVGSWMG